MFIVDKQRNMVITFSFSIPQKSFRIVKTFQYSYLKKGFSKSIEVYTENSNQSVNQLLPFTYRALVI